MSILFSYFQGCLLGLSIAAPVGPIGLLCIRYSVTNGIKWGLAVGLGAALADSTYGFLVGGGFKFVHQFLIHYAIWIKLLSSFFLIFLAYKELKTQLRVNNNSIPITKSLLTLSSSTFGLTLMNPLTILSFIAIFSINISEHYAVVKIIAIVLGVFCGSMLWWLLLSNLAHSTKKFMTTGFMKKLNYFSAAILIAFAFYGLIRSGL